MIPGMFFFLQETRKNPSPWEVTRRLGVFRGPKFGSLGSSLQIFHHPIAVPWRWELMKGMAMLLYAIETLKMASGWSKPRLFGGSMVDGGRKTIVFLCVLIPVLGVSEISGATLHVRRIGGIVFVDLSPYNCKVYPNICI